MYKNHILLIYKKVFFCNKYQISILFAKNIFQRAIGEAGYHTAFAMRNHEFEARIGPLN